MPTIMALMMPARSKQDKPPNQHDQNRAAAAGQVPLGPPMLTWASSLTLEAYHESGCSSGTKNHLESLVCPHGQGLSGRGAAAVLPRAGRSRLIQPCLPTAVRVSTCRCGLATAIALGWLCKLPACLGPCRLLSTHRRQCPRPPNGRGTPSMMAPSRTLTPSPKYNNNNYNKHYERVSDPCSSTEPVLTAPSVHSSVYISFILGSCGRAGRPARARTQPAPSAPPAPGRRQRPWPGEGGGGQGG